MPLRIFGSANKCRSMITYHISNQASTDFTYNEEKYFLLLAFYIFLSSSRTRFELVFRCSLILIVVTVLWAKNPNELREFDEKIIHLYLKTNTKCK